MQDTQEIGTTLTGLVEICRDGQYGFSTAARATKDSSLRAELMEYSAQRQGFAEDLEAVLTSMGESSHEGGSVGGSLHRGWINLKAAIASNDEYAVLAECERGEDSAVKTYCEAITGAFPAPLEAIIQSQYEQVLLTHDRVKELRDAARAK